MDLNLKQLEFVRHYCSNGGHGRDAARKAGYKPTNAAQTASDLLKNPKIEAEIQKHQLKLAEKTQYGLEQAFQDAVDGAEFARLHKNSMALHKFIELKAKLNGLLVERHEVDTKLTVDIGQSLMRMQARLAEAYGGGPGHEPAIDVAETVHGVITGAVRTKVDDIF